MGMQAHKNLLDSLSLMKSHCAGGEEDFLAEGRAARLAQLPPGTSESAREGRCACPKRGEIIN